MWLAGKITRTSVPDVACPPTGNENKKSNRIENRNKCTIEGISKNKANVDKDQMKMKVELKVR